MITHHSRSARSAWQGLRDDLRGRRQALALRRGLATELASYRSPSDVNDLLAMIRDQDTAEADVVRDVLLHNLDQRRSPHRRAS